VVAPPPGLIYSTEEGVWRIDPDGESEYLIAWPPHVYEFAFSPDGAHALYADTVEEDVWLVDLETGEQRNLTQTPDRGEVCPVWWPARPGVVVFGSWARGSDEYSINAGHLSMVRLDGSDYRVLDEEQATCGDWAVSPDGQRIAYGRRGNASFYRWGVGIEQLDPAAYGLSVVGLANPDWSPDGKRIAWRVWQESGGWYQTGIAVFDLEAGDSSLPLVGGQLRARNNCRCEFGSFWSPDGQWLYGYGYFEVPSKGGGTEPGLAVGIVRPDGTKSHLLSGQYWQVGARPIWNPDGSQLAFGQGAVYSNAFWHQAVQGVTLLLDISTWTVQQLDLPPGAQVIAWIER